LLNDYCHFGFRVDNLHNSGIILEANVGAPGACGDSSIWQLQPLYKLLSRAYDREAEADSCWIPPDGFIVCDQAYCSRSYQLQPFSDAQALSQAQLRYNLIVRKARRVVERVFGIMKLQFQYLTKPTSCSAAKMPS
jgi:hypothetical protein